jgi:hypothetical protein
VMLQLTHQLDTVCDAPADAPLDTVCDAPADPPLDTGCDYSRFKYSVCKNLKENFGAKGLKGCGRLSYGKSSS